MLTGVKAFTASRARMRSLGKLLSYGILVVMSLIMLLPLLWLVNGSFQPEWQIKANPVIWIPREWNTVTAGDTGQKLLLWWAANPDGRREPAVQIGARRYTPAIDIARLQSLQSVPKDQLGEAQPVEVNGILLNVRDWDGPQGQNKVVALARDGGQEGNLIVAETGALEGGLAQYPLDQVNQASRQKARVAGFELDVRRFEGERQVFVLGPETELAVMGAPEVVREAQLIQSSRLGKKEYLGIGQTQLPAYPVEGEPDNFRAIAVSTENWQPLLARSVVADHGFIAGVEDLSQESQTEVFNGLNMTVRTYSPPDGGNPFQVAVLIPGSTEFLVIPTGHLDALFAGPIDELIEPGSVNLGTLTYRVKEDFEKDSQITPSALVGETQELSLIVPAGAVQEAFDISPAGLERSTRVRLNTNGFMRVLTLKLSGVPFWRFFANSGYVVLMNIIGHFLSCTLVAYGFARFRAPGKDLLFVILLGTLMVPNTIVTLPTYLVFRDLGFLGTMVPLWLRSFFGNAFLIFVLRQFFMAIPYELDEAAILDGASRLRVLTSILLPLSKPALASVGIFTFWWHWNSFLDPLIYINEHKYFTITRAMNAFNELYTHSTGYYDRILAGSVLTLLPMVLIFIFAQRYFIEGIQMQGLKQ
jgi:multiple sugar transport system permease protein